MPLMDEFRKEREDIKNQPFKKRIAYFWEYYKWYVIIGIVAIILIITTVKSLLDRRDYALYGVLLNALPIEEVNESEHGETPFTLNFEEYAGVDTGKERVSLNASLVMTDLADQNSINARQFIMVYIAAHDLDLAVMDTPRFSKYAYEDSYMDLRDLLDNKTLESLSGKLFYIDRAVVEQIADMDAASDDIEDVTTPDPFHPETMQDPIPVGINLADCQKFTDAYYYDNNDAVLGIILNTTKKDRALQFIQYLFPEAKGIEE